MSYRILYTSLLLVLCFLHIACDDKEKIFDSSPAARSKMSIETLRQELVSAPYGWRLLYFPRTDSLLFSNPTELIPFFSGRLGYGGICFTMRFTPDNVVEMLADFDSESATTVARSEYLVGRNSFTQLSFETYSYIHRLVNANYMGASDFLFVRKNEDGDLLFRTARNIEPAREYVVLHKLDKAEDFTEAVSKAQENRHFFEEMTNPQLRIYKGARTYFQSDMYVKRDVETNKRYLKEIRDKRYYLFLFAQKKAPLPTDPPKEQVGLGSGYAGTELGITFQAGLRYDSKYIFHDFVREGDVFIAELVSVYDPLLRTTRLVSKHLHPEGEYTGFKAEIWDKK